MLEILHVSGIRVNYIVLAVVDYLEAPQVVQMELVVNYLLVGTMVWVVSYLSMVMMMLVVNYLSVGTMMLVVNYL